jgi:hypothetical protein
MRNRALNWVHMSEPSQPLQFRTDSAAMSRRRTDIYRESSRVNSALFSQTSQIHQGWC